MDGVSLFAEDVFFMPGFKGVAKDGVGGTLKLKSVEGVECRGPPSVLSVGGLGENNEGEPVGDK